MANGLLDGINASNLSKFRKEFLQMAKVSLEIDRHYGKSSAGLDSQIKKFERLSEEFSKKYGITLKTKKSVERFTLRIFIKEPGLKDFFANSASKISGLKSIGRTGFNQADVSDMEKFSKLLDSLTDKVFVSYSDAENGTGKFSAFFDRRENMVELIILIEAIKNKNKLGMDWNCCWRCQRYNHCEINWYRGERGLLKTCCPNCVNYRDCNKIFISQRVGKCCA